MGLRLFFLPNFPGATFIQEAKFIPDSRVEVPVCTTNFVIFFSLIQLKRIKEG